MDVKLSAKGVWSMQAPPLYNLQDLEDLLWLAAI